LSHFIISFLSDHLIFNPGVFAKFRHQVAMKSMSLSNLILSGQKLAH